MALLRKAAKVSAGILLYRLPANGPEVFLVHPGGPFWAKRDLGSWSVPKGEVDGDEDLLEAAKREFHEETGARIEGEFIELAPLRQPSGKVVRVWAVEGEIDAGSIASNTFSIVWPPRSGESREFPEVDRCRMVHARRSARQAAAGPTAVARAVGTESSGMKSELQRPTPRTRGNHR